MLLNLGPYPLPFIRFSLAHDIARRCAFVNFKDRPTAERAAEAWANGLEIDEVTVAVKWGRSRTTAPQKPVASASTVAVES